jgi:uncharacterized protein (TIGR02466 family)
MDSNLNPSEAFGVFPTPMYSTTLKTLDYQEVIDAVEESGGFHKNDGGNKISANKYILNSPSLSSLFGEVSSHLNQFLSEVMRLKTQFNITQSWVNVNPRGTHHTEHTHRNSVWNCVMFLKDHPTPMTFRDPNPWRDIWDFSSQTVESNWANSNLNHIYPTKGKLIIFPYYLHHSVGVNEFEEERISLAFNTWFKDDFGSAERLTATRTYNGT